MTLSATQLTGFMGHTSGAAAEVAYTNLQSGDWQGDTASFTLGDGTVQGNATDKNVRTSDTLVAISQDFDFEVTGGAWGTANGPYIGFCDNGTGTGNQQPTAINPVVYARNGSVSPGWANNDNTIEAAKTAGWTASVIIKISRRGSTLYGSIDGVLDRTFTGTTSSAAGKFFLGCGGAAAWGAGATGVRYRLGPGLPDIA